MIGYIAYDPDLKRPGCAVVAAAVGGDPKFCHHFDSKTWLTTPTPGMRVLPVENEGVLARIVEITEQANP